MVGVNLPRALLGQGASKLYVQRKYVVSITSDDIKDMQRNDHADG